MPKLFHPLIVLFLFIASPALAFWQGSVDDVRGCGFILIRNQGGPPQSPVRLHGIECPDMETGKGRAAGEKVQKALQELLPKGLTVTVHDMKVDIVGRFTGSFITLPDRRIVQEVLLGAGLARVSNRNCGNCWKWKNLEKEAREAKRGLWAGDDDIPWVDP